MNEHAELVRLLRFDILNEIDILSEKAQRAADAIEALERQYELRGKILVAAVERAEKAERERDAAVQIPDQHIDVLREMEK